MAERAARSAAFVLAVLGVLLLVSAGWSARVEPDADAYWLAANRLRDGLPLYVSFADDTQIYRYAPWFAFTWVPLTYLPQDVAYGVWRLILVVSTIAAVLPIIRRPSAAGITLGLLLGGLLLSSVWAGNVTPLIVGLLVAGLRNRLGPILLGLAGSLKIFPLVFVAGYVAERRWLDAAVALGTSAMLWATILGYDVLFYTEIGGSDFYIGGVSLYSVSPTFWLATAAALALAMLRLAAVRSGWTWLAAATAIPLAVPRVWLPDAAYLLVGIAHSPARGDRQIVSGTPAGRGPGSRPDTARTSPPPSLGRA